MELTNMQMDAMREVAAKHLDRRDMIGYACARNVRALEDELREYLDVKDALVVEYGAAEEDEEGNPTGSYRFVPGSEEHRAFLRELAPYMDVTGDPRIMKLKYEEAIGKLTGQELIELDWMFED